MAVGEMMIGKRTQRRRQSHLLGECITQRHLSYCMFRFAGLLLGGAGKDEWLNSPLLLAFLQVRTSCVCCYDSMTPYAVWAKHSSLVK